MRRPALTEKVIEGLGHVASVTDVELDAGEDGAFGKRGGGSPEIEESALRALTYIRDLIEWYEKEEEGS